MLISHPILAFDTATGPASVAVWKNGALAAYHETPASAMQSAQLMPLIEQALRDSGVAYKNLSAIACTIGPGSFTGIRVGLAAARGICFASGIKGLGFTTLETLAMSGRKEKIPLLALLNAGKGEHYYQGFDAQGKPLFDPRLGTLEAAISAMPATFSTVGNATLPGIPSLPATFPRADALAQLAAAHIGDAATLKPFYIRPPDAIPLNAAQNIL
jgi:tRNA threonylcarbamoyladenosine biosynthesis protein TsaB